MQSLLEKIKQRRLELGFKQKDMQLRVGISRQVYQRLESKGNPRLDTLELVAVGLNSELMLIPLDKVNAVKAILESDDNASHESEKISESLLDDPWRSVLGDDL